MASLFIGTSAFTAAGWEGSFYPAGTKPADYLRCYSQHFNSIEVDSTFYRTPSKGILEAIDMDSYRVEKQAAIKIQLPDQNAEIEPVPTSGGVISLSLN